MRKIIKSRKGISHVEVILSFVIFAGFLVFLFAIFNPLKVKDKGDVYLDKVERKIINYISTSVEFITIKVNEDVVEECFYFDYNFDNNIVVKNKNETKIGKAMRSDGKIYIKSLERFFYIYSSQEFIEENDFTPDENCKDLGTAEYTLGLYRNYKLVSESKLNELYTNLIEDYENIKEQFKFRKDFSISVRESTGEIIFEATKNAPKTNVLAKDVHVQIIKNDGSFDYAVLNIQVW